MYLFRYFVFLEFSSNLDQTRRLVIVNDLILVSQAAQGIAGYCNGILNVFVMSDCCSSIVRTI
jgi:hypothetical protein